MIKMLPHMGGIFPSIWRYETLKPQPITPLNGSVTHARAPGPPKMCFSSGGPLKNPAPKKIGSLRWETNPG